jgi:hypothetical protein
VPVLTLERPAKKRTESRAQEDREVVSNLRHLGPLLNDVRLSLFRKALGTSVAEAIEQPQLQWPTIRLASYNQQAVAHHATRWT